MSRKPRHYKSRHYKPGRYPHARNRNPQKGMMAELWDAAQDAFGLDARSDAPSQRANKPSTDAAERFRSSHWGVASDKVYEDPDIDGTLVEMGKLRELHIEWPDEAGKMETDTLTFPKANRTQQPPLVAFTTDNAERLYLSQPEWVKRRNKDLIDAGGEWYGLSEAAKYAGGRQAQWDYPDIDVQVLGYRTAIVYATTKHGDGPSEYIHHFGEEKTAQSACPLLCIDDDGRLWLAGGSYSVPDEGITD